MQKQAGLIQRIMVLCVGNICRSPMAAAMFRENLRQIRPQLEVASAGLGVRDGEQADPVAVKLMAERGLDIDSHRATKFLPCDGIESDLILVMDEEMRYFLEENWPLLQGRVYRLGYWGKFDVDDPHQNGERAFRIALKSIDAGVAQWRKSITA